MAWVGTSVFRKDLNIRQELVGVVSMQTGADIQAAVRQSDDGLRRPESRHTNMNEKIYWCSRNLLPVRVCSEREEDAARVCLLMIYAVGALSLC